MICCLFISVIIVFYAIYRQKVKRNSHFSKYVTEFIETGITVIPNILDDEEINQIKQDFHRSLASKGCDVKDLMNTAYTLEKLSSTNGSGGVLDIFYEPWKLRVNENKKIFSAISQLWGETFSKCSGIYSHPYGKFEASKGFMLIDRVCFRLPEEVSNGGLPTLPSENKEPKLKKPLQRSLAPHLDCCPQSLHQPKLIEDESKDCNSCPKWRPIQCFLALTDSLMPDCGGFEACPGFHRNFDQWIQQRPGVLKTIKSSKNKKEVISLPPPCIGDFTPIRPVEDAEVMKQFCHIPIKAGDLVCWDYRIPHANSRYNNAKIPREVVYLGFLPFVDCNRHYAKIQLQRFYEGKVPNAQWHDSERIEQRCNHEFSVLGSLLMGMRNDWHVLSKSY
jgi:ectoine hydroxylase-related dioxygenase (phytanoyl-CoA dioxygenase family)